MKVTNILKRTIGTIAVPLLSFIICSIICAANGTSLFGAGESSFIIFLRATATVMLVTFALHINLNSGRFDFSLGAIALLSSLISAKICNDAGLPTVVMLFISIIAGAFFGFLSGLLYTILRLPAIIVSLGVTLLYEGLAHIITSGYNVSFVTNTELTSFPSVISYLCVIVFALAAIILIFDYTSFGYNHKSLMYGQKISVNTGIKEVKNCLISYTICGVLMGVVGFISATNIGTVQISLNFGSIAVMFTAFFPMFVGGFIGRFSNDKLGYMLGAMTSAFVSLMYSVLNVDTSIQQIVTALILVLFVVYLSNEGLIKKIFSMPFGKLKKGRE